MPSPRIYKATLDEHRRRLARVAERRGVGQLRRLYEEGQAAVTKQLARAVRTSSKFTALQQSIFLVQLRQGEALLAKRMVGELGDITYEAQVEALRGLISDMHKLERSFTGADIVLPIEEASRFRGVVTGRRESLLRAHETSVAKYTGQVVTKMEDEISLSLMAGETAGDAIDRVMDVADTEWWQAERIARTETVWAFNATQYDGMKEASEELPDMLVRWNEFVSDDGVPLDNRVGADSLAMHGQVAAVGTPFVFPSTMPDGSPIPKEARHLLGESWSFPPNRPNDRATLSPWRPHWGVPGWRLEGGLRVQL